MEDLMWERLVQKARRAMRRRNSLLRRAVEAMRDEQLGASSLPQASALFTRRLVA